MKYMLTLLLSLSAFLLSPAQEYWIFAGQSNMSEKTQSREAFRVLSAEKGKSKRVMLGAQSDGKPIAFWQPGNKGGDMLDKAFATVGEGELAGFVWQQGESNQSLWHRYETQLRALIKRIRTESGNPQLPIYINQLGPRFVAKGVLTKTGMKQARRSKEMGFVTVWNMAFMRELQRRVAMSNPNIHLVATIDLTLRDKGVHFGGQAHQEIGRRVGLMASGKPAGPIPVEVRRDPADPKTLLLVCTRVEGTVALVDGWKTAAGLSPKPAKAVPSDLSKWPAEDASMHPSTLLPLTEVRTPVAARVVDERTVAFSFEEPIGEGALFHWCYLPGGNESDDLETQPRMTGIVDDTGVTLAPAALLPVK